MGVVDNTPDTPRRRKRREAAATASSSRTESNDRKKSRKKTRAKKPPKPPVVVNPGPVHELLAALLLKTVQSVAEKNGVELNVGDVKTVDEYLQTATGEGDATEGPQPIDVASRVMAHIWNRTPGARKIAKKFEGKDNKSGFFSDLTVLISQLGAKNEEIIRDRAGDAVSSIIADKFGGGPSNSNVVHVQPIDVPIVEDDVPVIHNFGPVDPIPNQNEGEQ